MAVSTFCPLVSPWGFFRIEKLIFHIRAGQDCACPVKTIGCTMSGAAGQDIAGKRPGKRRVTQEYGQIVSEALTGAAFFGGFQSGFDFKGALGQLHRVHDVCQCLLRLRWEICALGWKIYFAQSV